MSTIIKFDLKDLRKLTSDKSSCVIEKKLTQNLALQPWCLGNLKESIKNLLDYKIGKFDKEFDGIVLSYKNLRVLQNVGTIRNDNSEIQFQVQAEYFIFRPYVGATLTGIVNTKSVTHLGILVHRVFNVVIPRPTEEPGNKWIGTSVKEGQEVAFKIVVLDLFGALPYIRGELDPSSLDNGLESENKLQLLNVGYVDFDKTKPTQLQRPSGDLSPKNRESFSNSIEKVVNLKKSTNNPNESTISLSAKSKKIQNKLHETDSKQIDISKASKKHKRNS